MERWVQQFSEGVQHKILAEINHLLPKTYISRDKTVEFLRDLTTHRKFCGGDPKAFWRGANLLDIQQGGNSQREMLAMFGELLKEELGLELADCGGNDGPFIYIDDGLFGGGRIRQDLTTWIENDAPKECELRIVVAALHMLGQYYVDKELGKLRTNTGKKIELSWWRIQEVENRRYFKHESDVLWPTAIPDGPLAEAYVRYMTEEAPRYKVELRTPGSIGEHEFFSSDKSRILLEQETLVTGLQIRKRCPYLPETARPLGATLLKTFGFGATIVTFRNCPNNCPLAWWAGDPWYPLFPRSTNSSTFMKRLLESLRRKRARKG